MTLQYVDYEIIGTGPIVVLQVQCKGPKMADITDNDNE